MKTGRRGKSEGTRFRCIDPIESSNLQHSFCYQRHQEMPRSCITFLQGSSRSGRHSVRRVEPTRGRFTLLRRSTLFCGGTDGFETSETFQFHRHSRFGGAAIWSTAQKRSLCCAHALVGDQNTQSNTSSAHTNAKTTPNYEHKNRSEKCIARIVHRPYCRARYWRGRR